MKAELAKKKQEYIKKRKIDEVQKIRHSDDNHDKKKDIDLDYYQELLANRLKKMKLEEDNKNNKTAELIENINFEEEFYL